ncbi:biological adhesion [Mactra antiquata]
MFPPRPVLFCVLLALVSGDDGHCKDCVTRDEMSVYIDKINKLEETVRTQEIQIRRQRDIIDRGHTRKRHVEQPVAFTATINQEYITHVGGHQTIVFPDVITNIGANYHSQHGLFTAPISGLYLVSTTLLSGHNSAFAATIEVNGHDVVRLREMGTGSFHGSSSQTIVLHLIKDDDVAVQSLSSDKLFWGDKYCSFTVVLLQEMDTIPTVVG